VYSFYCPKCNKVVKSLSGPTCHRAICNTRPSPQEEAQGMREIYARWRREEAEARSRREVDARLHKDAVQKNTYGRERPSHSVELQHEYAHIEAWLDDQELHRAGHTSASSSDLSSNHTDRDLSPHGTVDDHRRKLTLDVKQASPALQDSRGHDMRRASLNGRGTTREIVRVSKLYRRDRRG
jgi:hypothetical protein